jgi:hypothetical protein
LWVARERGLQDGSLVGVHEKRMVKAVPARNGSVPAPQFVEPDESMPEPEPDLGIDEPRRRRPPSPAEQWGAPHVDGQGTTT